MISSFFRTNRKQNKKFLLEFQQIKSENKTRIDQFDNNFHFENEKEKKWFEKQQISSMFDINIFGFGIDNINRMECIIIDSKRQNNNNKKK